MTISQGGIKQPLEKESNFKKTLKIFETPTSDNMSINTNTNALLPGSSKPSTRKSLIPTIMNQKNYYSKFPFEKIIEAQQRNINEANNKHTVPKSTAITVTDHIKHSDESNTSSNILIKNNTQSISTDGNRSRLDATPQLVIQQPVLHRQQHLTSPPMVTPRSSIYKQNNPGGNHTPRQQQPSQHQFYPSPPSLNNTNTTNAANKIRNNLYRQQALSPSNQPQLRTTKSPIEKSLSPPPIQLPVTPRSKSKQQYLQQYNNRQLQLQKAPLKIPVIQTKTNQQLTNDMRLKENESKMRESRLDNQNAFDLNSETILILPNKEKTQIESVRLSATPNGRIQMKKVKKVIDPLLYRPNANQNQVTVDMHQISNNNSRQGRPNVNHNQMPNEYTRPEDLTDSSLSSESFITSKVEKTQTLFELVSFLKIYLRKMENSYSLDELYTFLKTNVKFNGYRNFTIELLERFSKPKYTSCLGVYNDTNASNEPQLQANNHPASIRSLSQLKPSPNPVNNSNANRSKTHKAIKPVQKLLKNLSIFKTLFHIVQRDLVVNIFLLDIPKLSQYDPETHLLKSLELTNDNRPISRSKNAQQTDTQIFKSNRLKLIQRIKKYHEILYDLNEKLSILINDHRTCELSLLSPLSSLQSKYLYYKHGEYVLRLTTDIISKFKMIINISQSVYYLNYKLKENDFSCVPPSDDLESNGADHNDREFNFYACSEAEQKKQFSVLKQMARKKAQAFQKLPTLPTVKAADPKIQGGDLKKNLVINSINSKNSTINQKPSSTMPINGIEIGPHIIKNSKKPKLETLDSLENGQETMRNQELVSVEQNTKVSPIEKEIIKEDLKEKLLRIDSNDSFIRETDSSSITSENDSVLCFIDELEQENEIKKLESLNNNTIIPYTDSFQVQQDTNKLLEQHKVLSKQLDMSHQKYKELNFYLETLIERAERCNHLKMQLKADQDLIRITENNLRDYNSQNQQMNIKQRLQGRSNTNRKQLEKQQDFLAYRFNLNLQDLTLEMAGAPQVNYEIEETEKKISNLHLIIKDLNKYKYYVESRLSKHLLNIQL